MDSLRTVSTLVFLVLITSINAAPAFGFGGVIGVYADNAGTECRMMDTAGPVWVDMVHIGSDGTTGSAFTARIPDCWVGATYLADILPFSVILGNTQTGITVGYGSCINDFTIPIGQILVMSPGTTTGCCPYPVTFHPTYGDVISVNCSAQNESAGANCGVISSNIPTCPCQFGCVPEVGPSSPPDGAVGVPTTVQLSWGEYGISTYDVYFGTTPSPPMVADNIDLPEFDPGILQPATTYYWRVVACPVTQTPPHGTPCGYSPTWTFSTEGTVPTEEHTWGSIKELFRADGI